MESVSTVSSPATLVAQPLWELDDHEGSFASGMARAEGNFLVLEMFKSCRSFFPFQR